MTAKRDPKRDDEIGPGFKAYTLTEPVDTDVLDLQVVVEGLAGASAKTPATLWVDADLTPDAVRKAVSAAQEVEAPVSAADELAPLRAKAQRGDNLTDDEMQTALRLLLTRG